MIPKSRIERGRSATFRSGSYLHVKICGVRTVGEARHAADQGADFLGLNFHPPSPRYVGPEPAAEIAVAVRETHPEVRLVGVFVNLAPAEVEAIARRVGLDFVQAHGDVQLHGIPPDKVIQVFRIRDRVDPDVVVGYDTVWGYLFDYKHPRLYGGSGESWDFSSLAKLRFNKPTFIAGGLGPDNVRAAVKASSPWGIDICSGVEKAPGKKDPELVARLFEEIADFRKETHHGQSPTTT